MPHEHGDLEKSPFTGYTRTHWETICDSWWQAGAAYASPRGALWRIPGRHAYSGPESDALEGFARSFLLVAGRIAGGGDRLDLAERHAEALTAGSQPGGDEAWPCAVDCAPSPAGKTQPTVEAANIAFALHLTRGQIWQHLDAKEQLADWLAHHAKLQVWSNNWVLFPAVIEAFLASVGYDTTTFRRDEEVRWVESWHLGGGWYTDGQRRNIDYYNAWAIHPFLWAWYDMVGDARDPDGKARWRQRFAQFLTDYPLMFGDNGSPVQQGRSLTYRTATLAPLWLGALTGATTLTPGALRGIASSCLKYFVDAGVGADGPLSLGWGGGEYLPVTQTYSGTGSPYFAGMGFGGLALPADHPLWTDMEEEPERRLAPLPGPGLLLSPQSDGVVRLYNHGSDKITARSPEPDPLYIKYAYSSHAAPGHDEAFTDGVDNEFVLYDSEGEPHRRHHIETHRVDGPVAVSRSAFDRGTVTSASLISHDVEVRCHHVTGMTPQRVREGGFLLAGDVEPDTGTTDGWAWARDASGLVSAVRAVHGFARAEVGSFGRVNALGAHAAVPLLHGGTGEVFVSLHVLGHVESFETLRGDIEITVDGTVVSVHAGEVRGEVDLATALPTFESADE